MTQERVAELLENLRRNKPDLLPEEAWDKAIEALDGQISAGQKVSAWEWVQYDGNPAIGNWHCSLCRCIVEDSLARPRYNFCPMCGAKIIGEVEE